MTDPTESFATPRVTAGALFFNDQGYVLLVHPTDTWDIPGEYVERGESPAAACTREIAEELGLDRPVTGLLAVDWAPSEKEGDKLLSLFDCGPLGADEAQIKLDQSELDRWQWTALDELDELVLARIAKRIRSTAVQRDGTYLEHGRPIADSVQ